MIKTIKRTIWLLAFTALISGCAGFQSNQLSIISPDSSLLVKAEVMTYSITEDSTYGSLEAFDDALISEMNKYGWKMRQSPKAKSGVPHLDINLKLSKDPAALLPAMLTGFSLYTIPSWETSDYKLTANFINANGKEYDYEIGDDVVLVQWLPLLLAFPFANPFTAEKEIIEKLYNNLAHRLSKDNNLSHQLTNQGTQGQ